MSGSIFATLRSAACSLRASKLDDVEKRWRRLVVHCLVSDDAPFDARRTAPVKPPPRFTVSRWSRRSQSARR